MHPLRRCSTGCRHQLSAHSVNWTRCSDVLAPSRLVRFVLGSQPLRAPSTVAAGDASAKRRPSHGGSSRGSQGENDRSVTWPQMPPIEILAPQPRESRARLRSTTPPAGRPTTPDSARKAKVDKDEKKELQRNGAMTIPFHDGPKSSAPQPPKAFLDRMEKHRELQEKKAERIKDMQTKTAPAAPDRQRETAKAGRGLMQGWACAQMPKREQYCGIQSPASRSLCDMDRCSDEPATRSVGSSRGYEALEIIGRGSFGCAILARDPRGRRKAASSGLRFKQVLKVIDLECSSERRKREAPKEAEIMEKLKHPYIESRLNYAAVRIHETFAEDTALIIVMEYAGSGDLRKQVKDARDAVADSAKSYAEWFQTKAVRRLRRLESRRENPGSDNLSWFCRRYAASLFKLERFHEVFQDATAPGFFEVPTSKNVAKSDLRKLAASGDWSSLPKNTLKALLRKGVPHEHRPELWWSILGCEAERLRSPVSFRQYLEEPVDSATAETIERDLPRTFPNHQKFRCAAGRAELRNVLRAFSRRCPAVRYCQGMNFIAALLLIVSQDEERAFWMFVCAFDALGVEGYYTEGMTLLRADMQVLASCMQAKCAKVSRTLNQFNVDLLSISSEWYITWFAKSLPVSTVLRVWDTLFFEGFKVLFRVSIGIFKQIEQDVLKSDGFDAIMQQAKRWPRSLVEHNELMKASFQGLPSFPRHQLQKAREEALGRIEKEDFERKRAAKARLKEVQETARKESSRARVSREPWITQALVGLRHIHSMSILHRDLKSVACIAMPCQDRLRIGDFGIACAVKPPNKAVLESNVVGTPYYMSPETCSMGLHSFAGDVWAMGCVLYELSALKLPYHGDTLDELMAEITRRAGQVYAAVLSHNRNKRPSASDVLFMQPLHQTLESLLEESGPKESEKAKISRPSSAPPRKRAPAAAAPQGDTAYPSLEKAPDEGSPAQLPGTVAPFRRLQELRRNADAPLPVLCAAAPPEEPLPPLRPSSAGLRSASARKDPQPRTQVRTPRIAGDCQRLLSRTWQLQTFQTKNFSRAVLKWTALHEARRLVVVKASALDAAKSLSQAVARGARQALRRGTQQPKKVPDAMLTGIVQEVYAESATASRSQVRSRAMVRSESEPPIEIYAETTAAAHTAARGSVALWRCSGECAIDGRALNDAGSQTLPSRCNL
eukprot:s955_g13.t1